MDVIKRASENKVIKGVCTFLETSFFPILLAVIAFFFYSRNLPVVTLAVFAAFAIFICLFSKDTRGILAIAMLVVFSFRYKDNAAAYVTKGAFITYAVFVPLVVFAAVYRLTFRRVEWKKKSGLLSMALLSVAILFGGVFTPYYTLRSFGYAVAISAVLFGTYAFFAFTLEKRENNLVYVARVCVIALCLISCEVLELYSRLYTRGTPLDGGWKSKVILGWSLSNMVGEMMALTLPALFYLIYKERFGVLYWLLLPVGMVGIYFTLSRNAMLWAAICTLIGVAVTCMKGRNKEWNKTCVFVLFLLAIAAFAFLYVYGYLDSLLEFIIDVKMDDHGRFEIWEYHYAFFLKSPIHGVGFSAYHDLSFTVVTYAHNILVQILASTGFIGSILYLVHWGLIFSFVFKKPTLDKGFMFACVVMMIALSMLSPLFFLPYCSVYYVALLLTIEKDS